MEDSIPFDKMKALRRKMEVSRKKRESHPPSNAILMRSQANNIERKESEIY